MVLNTDMEFIVKTGEPETFVDVINAACKFAFALICEERLAAIVASVLDPVTVEVTVTGPPLIPESLIVSETVSPLFIVPPKVALVARFGFSRSDIRSPAS